jgi:hypothetical protein
LNRPTESLCSDITPNHAQPGRRITASKEDDWSDVLRVSNWDDRRYRFEWYESFVQPSLLKAIPITFHLNFWH